MGLTDWIQGILRSRRNHASRQASRQQRAALSPGLFVRELEERRVLSVDTLPWDEPFRQLVLDASLQADDGAADSFQLAAESEALQAGMDDQPTEAVHLSTVSAVRVEVADGVDALRIDFSGSGPNGGEFTVAVADNTLHAIVDGNVIATHSLDGIQSLYLTGVVGQNDVVTLDFRSNPDLLKLSTIHVDLEGDASDDLVVISDGQAVRIDYTDVSSGEITVGATSVVFTGLGENTLTVNGTDNLTLTFSDTAENIVFTNHADVGVSQVSYQVGGDSFTTTFANPATILTVNLGDNGPTATFTSLDAAFNPTAGVTINGGTGNDTITITSLGTGFSGALAVDGGDGSDSVTFDAVLALASLNVTAETIPVSGASVSTSGGNIDLNGNLTLLGANVLLSTGTGGGNISIGSITGGGNSLQLISGSGTTTVAGSATGLGTLTLQENAATSTGAVSFEGGLTATTLTTFARPYSVSLTGDSSTISNAVTFSNTGMLTLGNDAGDSTVFTGGVTATAPSSKSLAGTISAGTGVINLGATGVTVTSSATVGGTSTGAITLGNATIQDGATLTVGGGAATPVNLGSVSGVADGAASHLTISTTGAVTVGGAVGTDIGTVTVTNSGGTTFQSTVSAATVSLAGTVAGQTVSFQGNLTLGGGLTAATGAYNVSITGASNSITGASTFDNTGTLTLGNNAMDNTAFTGGVTATVPSSKSIAGTISAAGTGVINLGTTGVTVTANTTLGGTSTGAITLGNATIPNSVTLTVGAGAATPVNLGSVSGVAGGAASHLTIDTAGAVTVVGAVATDIGTITVTNSGGTTFQSTVTAATVSLVDTVASQTVSFQGNLTLSGGLTAAAGAYNVSITGANNSIAGATTFSNTGGVTLGDGGDTITFTGGVTSTAGPTTVHGTVNTTNANATFGALTLGGNSGISTGAGAGNIAIGSIVGASNNLQLISGNGTTTVAGAATGLGTLTLQQNATSSTGTMWFQGDLAAASLITFARSYQVRLTGSSTAITGATTFLNTGMLTLGDDADDVTAFIGGVTATAPSSKSLAGTISAVGTGIINLGTTAVTVTASATLGGTSTGAITLGSTTVQDGATLTVGAGAATPVSLGTVSGVASGAASHLTINTAGAVTVGVVGTDIGTVTVTNSGGTTFQSTVNAATVSLVGTVASQTVSFLGNLTVGGDMTAAAGAYNVSITGTSNSIAGATTFINTGGLTLGNAGGDTINFTGGVTRTGGLTTVHGTVNTANADATFGALTLGGNSVISTGTEAGNIQIGSITGGGHNLQLISGSGTTTVTGAATGLGTLTLQENAATSTGAVSFEGGLTATTLTTFARPYSVSLAGGSSTITNAVTFINTGGVALGNAGGDTINFAGGVTSTVSPTTLSGTVFTTNANATFGALTLGGNSAISTGTGAGNLAIASIVGASNNLQLISGSGTTTVTGTATGLGTLTLQQDDASSTGAVSFQGNLTAAALTTFARGHSVSLTGATNTVTGASTFINTGAVTLGNGGDTFHFDGGVTRTGGPTTVHGTVNTANADATFGALTLGGDSVISTGTGAGNIQIASISGGNNHLQLVSGSGTTTVTGAATGLGTLTLQQDDASSTGAVSLEGNLSAATLTTFAQPYSVRLTGGSSTITTAVTFSNSGGVALGDGGDTINFTGGVTSTASPTTVHGIVNTANADATFGALTLAGNSVISTGTGAGNIAIGSIIGATNDLQLISGSGTTTVAGTATGLGTLTLQENAATSTGSVSFQGNLTADALTTFARGYSVSLTGGSSTITNAVTFSNTGGVTLGNDEGDTVHFAGGVTSTGSTTTVHGTVSTANAAAVFGALTLGGNSVISTGAGAGIIQIGSISGGGYDLQLISGSAPTTVTGTATGLGTLTLQQDDASSTGGAAFQGNLTAATLATFGQSYSVSLTGGSNTISNAVTFSNTGGVTLGNAGGDTFNFTDGVTSTGGPTTVHGTVNTANADATFGALTLAGNSAISTGSGAGSIQIGSIVGGGNSLHLISGSGTTTVTGAATGLGTLTLQENAATSTGAVSFEGGLSATTLTTFAQPYSIRLEGGTITNAVTFSNTGGVALGNAGGPITFTGGVTSTASPTTLSGTVNTTNTGATFGALTLGGNSAISTGSGPGNIQIGSITGATNDLQLISGSGTTTVTGTATGLGTVTLQENAATSTGSVSFQGNLTAAALTTFAQSYSVSLTGSSSTITNPVSFNNTGGVTLGNDEGDTVHFAGGVTSTGSTTTVHGTVSTANAAGVFGALTLSGNSVISAGAGAGIIQIGSISGGGHNLQLISGSGTTTVTGAATGLGTLTLQQDDASSTGGVAFQGNLTAATLATFGQAYSVSLTGGSSTISNAVTFSNTGGVTLGDDGGTINFAGAVTSTASATTVHGTVNTANADATFGTLTLGGNSVIITGTGAGNIAIGSITGATNDLQLISGSGTTTVAGAATGLGTLTLQQNAASSTGTVWFQGDLSAAALTTFAQNYAVVLTGSSITITNAVTFSNTGGVTLGDASGDSIHFGAGPSSVSAGTMTVIGTVNATGGLNLSGTAVLAGTGTINGKVTTTGSASVSPGPATGILTINNGTNAALGLGAGTTFTAQVNGTTPGTAHDQLQVTGTIDLTGAVLNVSGTIVSSPGQIVVLIINDGSDSVIGTFADKPEGSVFTVNGIDFVISYKGGSQGNYVVLIEPGDATYGGTPGDDSFLLQQVTIDGVDYIQFYQNNVLVDQSLANTVSSITIDGLDGSDTLTVNYDASGGFFDRDIAFLGDELTEFPGDRLVVIGGMFTTTTYNFTGIAEGNVILVTESSGTATITYTGLESVINNSTSGDTVFNLRDLENPDVILVDNPDAGLMDLTGSTFTDVTFAASTTSLTIHGGSLADSFAVTSVDSAFRASLIIDGADGSDTIHLNTDLTLGSATSAGNLTLTAETINVSANSISTNGGAVAGNAVFNGQLALGNDLTITSGTGNVDFGGAVTIGTHDLTVASSTATDVSAGIAGSTGSVDIHATAATNVDGAIALSGAGTVRLDRAVIRGVNVTTVGGNITFDGPVSTDTGPVAVGTGIGGGHVDFNGMLALGGNVAITAGAGNVSFDGAVSIGTHDMTVLSSATTHVSAGIAGSTGNVDIHATAATNVDGAIALSGAGTVALDRAVIRGVNVTTVGGSITFDGPASTDAGPVVIGTGVNAGHVDFNGSLTLGGNAMISAGTGNVDFDGAVSIGAHDLTVVSSATTHVSGGIAGSTGSVDINATVATNVDGTVALSGAGTVTLDRATIRAANVTTVGGDITFDGPTSTDAGPVAIGTGAGGGSVDFNGILTLGGSVAISAGTGNVNFDEAVAIGERNLAVVSSTTTNVSAGITGSTGSVDINATAATNVDGAIALSGAGAVTLDRAVISGVNVTTVGGSIMFDGPTSTDSGEVAIGTGIGAGHVDFNDALTLGGHVAITAGAGNVSFDGAVLIGTSNLTVVSSSTTNVSAGITGSTGDVDLSASAATNVDGVIALSGAGTVRLDRAVISGANVTTVGGAITFDEFTSTNTGPVVIGTGDGGGSVDFNGILTLGGNLAIAAGTGNVDFDGAVLIGMHDLTVVSSASTNMSAGISGSTGSVDINATAATNVDAAIALSGAGAVRLAAAVIRGVNVTTFGGTITFDGPASIDTGPVEIGTGDGAGHVEFNGALTLGGNLAITAGAGNVDFEGAVSIGMHDLTIVSSATTNVSTEISGSTGNIYINATTETNVDGAIALSGAGSVTLGRAVISGVDITTVGGAITLDGPASTDTGPVAIGTGAGDGHVLFHGALGLGGNLMITAGTGNATFSGAVVIGEHNLTVVSATIATVAAGINGTTGNVDIAAATQTDVDGAIVLTGAGNIELDRAVVSGVDLTTAGGNITFDGPVSTDTGAVAVGTGTGGGHVLFDDTLNLGGNLTVSAGTGDATFSGEVVIGGHNLTVGSSTITAVAAGISGTTGNVNIAAAIRTDVDGAIALSGAGNIELDRAVVRGVDVTTAGGNITFDGPASTDAGDVAVSTGEGGGDVLFNDTLELGANLTIMAGGVEFNGTVDSRTGSPRSLDVRAGDGGVDFRSSVGEIGPLSSVVVRTSGEISVTTGSVIRTETSTLLTLPLELIVKEDPSRPFGSDGTPTQYLIVENAVGGSVLFVTWADGSTESKEDASGINDENLVLTYEYPGGFVLDRVLNGNSDLNVTVTLKTNESIVLEQATRDGEILNRATTTVSVVVFLPSGQFSAPPQSVQFQPPVQLLTVATDVKPLESRASGPTVFRVEEIQTAVEVTSTAVRELVIVKLGPLGEEGESYLLPEDALEDLNGLFQRFVAEGLPNGRYRIYLRESGFPPRKLLEFYKSGRSIGDPVREPGPGSNPLTPNASENSTAAPDASTEAAESTAPETTSSLKSVEQVPAETPTEPTERPLHPLIGAAAAASVGWQARRTRGRWAEEVEQAMEQAEPNRFTRGARWWRRLTGQGNSETRA